MIEGVVSQPISLDLSLSDGTTTLFPRAVIYLNGVFVVYIDLTSVANGLYHGSWTPSAPGEYAAQFITYSDAGHTMIAKYDIVVEFVLIRSVNQDSALFGLLGHAGENVRDDVLGFDGFGRPVNFRRRVFPDAATAMASTPGGTGEGEIFTIIGGAEHFSETKWHTLLRVKS